MGLNWTVNDYFSMLIQRDKRSHAALEMLVDDLHLDKERTITKFLQHSGSEDFLWGLVRLLGNSNSRVAGNSAYILGTLAESEVGSMRVIGLTDCGTAESNRILVDLTQMLTFDDSESVMNAAGTMGTLAESHDGRMWMLREKCLDQTLSHITELLSNENLWTASNAALVLARLTIAEEGCERILQHSSCDSILSRLILSLGVDEAGRGMNSAFAIGRLCDMESGRCKLLSLSESERMISALAKMLCCSDPGASKNSCFAVSCLATNRDGHSRLLKNSHAEEVLKTLSELLPSDDSETGWFAAMTLRTLASQPKGCLKLRDHPSVVPALKVVQARTDLSADLQEEVSQTLEILKKLEQPPSPKAEVIGPHEVDVTWQAATTKSGFNIKYQLYENSKCVYTGTELEYKSTKLEAHTQYQYRVRAVQEGDESPLSDPVVVLTEESVPSPPQNIRILGMTTTQLKIGWEPPEKPNGVLKGYYVFNGRSMVEHTLEHSSIVSGLQPSTVYEMQVCASTAKGKGPRVCISGTTSELGAHAPSKPEVSIRGRNQLHVAWKPPEVPLGRITRFDVCMNGEVVYSGTEQHFTATRLRPDTEYTFTVSAITSEGRCESRSTKKRTAKDEFEGDRAPLYQAPKKEPEVEKKEKKEEEPPKPARRRKVPTPSGEAPPKSATCRAGSAASIKATYRLTYTHGDQLRYKERSVIIESPPPPTQPGPAKAELVKSVSTSKNTSQRKSLVSSAVSQKTPPESTISELKSETPSETGHHVLPKTSNMPERQSTNLAKVQAWEFTLNTFTAEEIQKMASSMSASPRKAREEEEIYLPSVVGSENGSDQGKVMTKSGKIHILPKPKPPNKSMASPKVHRQLESPSKSSKSARQGLTDSSVDRSRTREGNDFLTVEIDKRGMRPHSDSVPGCERELEQLTIGKVLSRRNSMRSSASLDLDTERDPDNLSSPHSQWTSHIKRSEFPVTQDTMTRTFSTLNQNSFRPSVAHSRYKKGPMEFNAPLPNSVLGNGPPSYVQRANTFIASHRPSTRKKYDKRTPAGGITVPTSASHQWQPDLPASHKDKNHNKFVPMQMRTQPNNLPGTVNRQKTMALQNGGGLDSIGMNGFTVGSISRSKTDLGYQQMSTHHLQEEVLPNATHASHKYDSRSSNVGKGMIPSGQQVSALPKSSTRHRQQEAGAVIGGFAISNSAMPPDSNKLQGAR